MMMMNLGLHQDVENSSYNGNDDINNSSDINKRKRQLDDSEYGDDESDYDQETRELRPTRRAVGRPRGSKNKPKSVAAQYDHNNQLLQELPQHVPSLVLSSYTLEGETFDIMIKVSENMSLESLKQECEARGYTYKKSKSVTKEDLLFLLGPGTIAMHMTKVYDDFQILSGRLRKIDEENERIKAGNDQQRQQNLKNIREGAVSNSTNVQRKFLDQRSRERLEREHREVIPPPSHQMWVMPPVLPNGYPPVSNVQSPVSNVQSAVSNVQPPVPNGYQMPPNGHPVYYHHMYPNMPNMPNHMYPNHQMWGMPYHPSYMYPNHQQ